jgi:hypothetical protein
MATQSNTAPSGGTGNPYLDSLLTGNAWNLSDGQPIRVYFASGPISSQSKPWLNGVDSIAWTDAEIAGYAQALASYQNVCGLRFEIVNDYASADFVEWKVNPIQGFAGESGFPNGQFDKIDIVYSTDPTNYWGFPYPNGLTFSIFLHEAGHAGALHTHMMAEGASLRTILPFRVSSNSSGGKREIMGRTRTSRR